jgi:UDP-2-acetamido-3-amino-2,3-dideoxy-glucuronate N-acetyltransferase
MKLRDLKIVEIPQINDTRGSLIFAEVEQILPFTPKRFFVVHSVPSDEVRGEHAHKELHEFVVTLQGSVKIKVLDIDGERIFELNNPTMGLHIPPRTWRILYEYSADAILLVLASDKYDANDYIRDIEEFRRSQFA